MHLGLLRHGQLGMGREGGAAEADHAAIPDRLEDVAATGGRQVARLAPQIFLRCTGMGTNHDGFNPGSAHTRTQADKLDHTGHRRMVRHRQPILRAGDRLAAHNFLPGLDDGMRHLADMLRQRHDDVRRKRQAADPGVRRQLVGRRMHAPLEGLAAKIGEEFHRQYSVELRRPRHQLLDARLGHVPRRARMDDSRPCISPPP